MTAKIKICQYVVFIELRKFDTADIKCFTANKLVHWHLFIYSICNSLRKYFQNFKLKMYYRIFPAIRRGFRPSRMTSNNLISPMKFCYNTNSTLPKQCQSFRSVLQDGSRTFGLFWKEKNPSYNRRNTVISMKQWSDRNSYMDH